MATTAAAAASATATTGDKQQGLCGSFAMGGLAAFLEPPWAGSRECRSGLAMIIKVAVMPQWAPAGALQGCRTAVAISGSGVSVADSAFGIRLVANLSLESLINLRCRGSHGPHISVIIKRCPREKK